MKITCTDTGVNVVTSWGDGTDFDVGWCAVFRVKESGQFEFEYGWESLKRNGWEEHVQNYERELKLLCMKSDVIATGRDHRYYPSRSEIFYWFYNCHTDSWLEVSRVEAIKQYKENQGE